MCLYGVVRISSRMVTLECVRACVFACDCTVLAVYDYSWVLRSTVVVVDVVVVVVVVVVSIASVRIDVALHPCGTGGTALR